MLQSQQKQQFLLSLVLSLIGFGLVVGVVFAWGYVGRNSDTRNVKTGVNDV